MSAEEKNSEPILDRAIAEIHNEAIDPAVMREASERVWARLSAEQSTATGAELRTCADFAALLPEWRAGKLSPARAMLLEDHLHSCPRCRAASAGPRAAVEMRPRRAMPAVWKWAAAAAVAVAVGIGSWNAWDRFGVPGGPRATVASLDGTLYRVDGGENRPLIRGAALDENENIRTARGSKAIIRLRDGSLVEMRERTQFAVNERRAGVTIQLAAGSVIVQAAKQRSRHLYVATEDCTVSVTGTIFSVNHGLKGSRVAVVEGEVHVTQGEDTKVLHPGDQTMTSAKLTPVPVAEEFAWSQNADQYLAVLAELAKFRQKLEALPSPGLRYATRLLDMAPAGTTFYAAIPNVGATLGEANRIFHQQLEQSAPLREWWAEKMKSPDAQAKFDHALEVVEGFSAYLGPEVVVAFTGAANGHQPSPVVISTVAKQGLREYLEQKVSEVPLKIATDLSQTPAVQGDALCVYIGSDLVIAAKDWNEVKAVAAGSSTFAQSAFRGRIANAYSKGVEWLFAADLAAVTGKADESLQKTGIADARYVVAQHRSVSGLAENRIVVNFAQARRGAASWLAAPAPIRALDFVSADATFAVAAAIKSPAALLDDVFAMTGSTSNQLAEIESKLGLSVKEDLARPLGGEFALAVDGPLLPTPSWKLIVEVYDGPRFQQALERLISTANGEGAGVQLSNETVNGRTFYTLHSAKSPMDAHYVYDNGFLVAAPNRDLLLRAIEYRATGYTLTRSAKFMKLLPHDGQTNFSAMMYQTIGAALAPLSGTAMLTPEQQKALSAAAQTDPSLVLAYGETDRIELASSGTFFGLRFEQLLGLGAHPHGKS